ncbi:ABC transporter substrate-binding protein [Demequina sp. NBRC 110057]|uniref:ABC transporter substrate-binding protein n=1 Tax=Demequina sp. NBRC 110057 TaxID=1570346 RepID=UPI000A057F0B|nr:ABC transporter substrate-binding protein [Demequina sp. NBRC 110057]
MRMRKSSIVALSMATALTLTACSGNDNPETDPSTSGSNGGDATATQGTAALTIAKPDGAITTESNNPWIGDSSALKLGYINALYEPLAIVNLVDPTADVEPWLADTIEWSDDYTQLTLTAKDGVTWSDGEPFTVEDIAFTFQLFIDHPELDAAAIGLDSVAVDGDAVTLTFQAPMYVKQDKVLHKLIVPKHIWEGVADPTAETNMDPVGTGPYTLTQFTSQSVQLDARDDYWGGELAVPTLFYVSYNDNTALTTALANGDADWAQAFIPNVQSAYLDKDENNVYWAPAGLGIDTMFVNTTTAPFDDVAFRQAVNMVVDRTQHQAIAREGGVPELTSVTGLPTPAGDPFINDEYQGVNYTVDVDGAKAVLEDAGYTWEGETLMNPDGEAVTFTIQVPQGWNDYVTGISLIADEVAALGVEATVATPDVDTWWADRSNGDFQAVLNWTDTGATPYDIYSNIMDGRWLMPIGEAANYNFGRYDNPEATEALNAYATATDDDSRAAALETVQQIFVEDVPAIPVGTRPFISEFNTRNYVGWPSDEDPYVNADPTQPTTVKILTSLTPAS